MTGTDEVNAADEKRRKLEAVKQADAGYSIEGLVLDDRLLFPIAGEEGMSYLYLVAGKSLIRLDYMDSKGEIGRGYDVQGKIELEVHNDGYIYVPIAYRSKYEGVEPGTRYDVFMGGGDIAKSFNFVMWEGYKELELKDYYDFDEFPPPENVPRDKERYFYLWEDGIKEIKASSVLRERTAGGEEVAYDEKNLRQNLYDTGPGDYTGQINFFKKAWAEGVPGDGIGESLDIEFTVATDHMLVLNGYVNIFQRNLYKANNRVKTARIVSKNPEFFMVYEFDDVVKFSEIKFPQKTTRVTFFIEETYKGEKYSDTCITAVLLRQSMEFQDHWSVKGTTEYEEAVDNIIGSLVDEGILP
jgi:hypothetical protein